MPRPTWDPTRPQDSDQVSSFPSLHRADKTTLKDIIGTLGPFGSTTTTWRQVQVGDDTWLVQNLYFDGTNWNRDDTTKASVAIGLRSNGTVTVHKVAAGSNPVGASLPAPIATLDATSLFSALVAGTDPGGTEALRAQDLRAGETFFTQNLTLKGPRPWVDVRAFGAKGDGVTDDTAAIQAALDAVPTGGAEVVIPPGTYLVSNKLKIKSGTWLHGSGPSSIIKATATFPSDTDLPLGFQNPVMLRNSDYVLGNVDIVVSDLAIDATATDSSTLICLFLRNTDRCKVVRVHTRGGGDGIALTNSRDWEVVGCVAREHRNAGLDCWENCERGAFIGNHVVGTSSLHAYGILATGLTIENLSGTTRQIAIIGNHIVGVNDNGVWLQGGVMEGQVGSCLDCVVIGNVIDTVRTFHGIRASEGSGHIIVHNVIRAVQRVGIALVGEGSTGAATDCLVAFNSIIDANLAEALDIMAIDIGSNATHVVVAGNRIRGTTHRWGIVLRGGTTRCHVVNNIVDPGVDGVIANWGDATNIIGHNIGYTPQPAADISVGPSPFTYTNNSGYVEQVSVAGGTVSSITLRGVLTGLTSGMFTLYPGDSLVVTYTAAPTMRRFPI
jgi:hypothetical protein